MVPVVSGVSNTAGNYTVTTTGGGGGNTWVAPYNQAIQGYPLNHLNWNVGGGAIPLTFNYVQNTGTSSFTADQFKNLNIA